MSTQSSGRAARNLVAEQLGAVPELWDGLRSCAAESSSLSSIGIHTTKALRLFVLALSRMLARTARAL